MTPPTPGALRQRQWRKDHLATAREARRKLQQTRRTSWVCGAPNKSVRVEYPGCALPDWYSKTEYDRQRNAFPFGTAVWIDGVQVR